MPRLEDFIDKNEIRKTISMLKQEDDIFEIRILGNEKKRVISGYFKDADTLIDELNKVDLRGQNVYITLNKVNTDCFARSQRERFSANSQQTTSDNDIVGYQWLFIDLDPVRTTGVSSTDQELQEAKMLARKVYVYLQELGFEEPIKALSGNGCHLLYKISLKNDEDNVALIERCLKVLATLFDTKSVKVDTTNYNPSRICKLHGTLAQKGSSTEERPHRMSRIFSPDKPVKITSKAYLEKLAKELPDEHETIQKQRKQERYQINSDFDLVDFMSKNGLSYEIDTNDRSTIYKLDECPFNPTHTNGDAKIFHYHNGAIAFKCHHNSCRNYKWQDVRLKFDPDAYDYDNMYEDNGRIDLGWDKHNRMKSEEELHGTEFTEEDQKQMFRTAKEIIEDPEPEFEYIRTGITEIDNRLGGLQKTGVSVISGVRGSAKTTLVGQIMINAINDEQNVVCYSGELNNKKYLNWLIRQAAGKNHITEYGNYAKVDAQSSNKIIEWFGDHFHLYNNKFGNNFSNIERYLRMKLVEYKADLVVIDNLMALDLSKYDKDKYDAQTAFVWTLKNLAEITNTHIIFVAHPKKTKGFIRLEDISGSGNISNIVDNAFLVHRCNRDFEIGYKETFGVTPSQDGIKNATNVIEIAKDRENGTQDYFVQLFYEESSKRLKNSRDEYIIYGWDEEEDFTTDLPDDIPF